ncbi:hypothetical protein Sjap_004229 [Stephania japonica]|uniref:Uncharacterized protein n=1 Tax=Stephania japonica TaxID=461633 RepID=A0AAP0PKR0_9MAGN
MLSLNPPKPVSLFHHHPSILIPKPHQPTSLPALPPPKNRSLTSDKILHIASPVHRPMHKDELKQEDEQLLEDSSLLYKRHVDTFASWLLNKDAPNDKGMEVRVPKDKEDEARITKDKREKMRISKEKRKEVRIDESDFFNLLNDINLGEDLSNRKKKGRGPTKLLGANIIGGENPRLKVEWNERGQPIGKNSEKFVSLLGVLAKEMVPLNKPSWTKVNMGIKNTIWLLLLQKCIIEECRKKIVFRLIGKLWRNWKSMLSKKLKKSVSPSACKPLEVKEHEWNEFVQVRRSLEWKKKIKESSQDPNYKSSFSIKDDLLSQVIGPEHPGCVRGLGFGATSSNINAQLQVVSWKQAMNNKVNEVMERQKVMEEIISQLTSSMSHRDDNGNLEGKPCKLLHWIASGEVVAYGEISSTDPSL